jgi:Coenzyme PQQ synthesis protein D (PqqD)
MNTIDARLVLAPGLRVSAHDEGAVILDIDGGQLYSTNKVGARIIALLGEKVNLHDIAGRIRSEFDAPPDRARADLDRFVESLGSRGLLRT